MAGLESKLLRPNHYESARHVAFAVRIIHLVFFGYIALAGAATIFAAVRLADSTAFPGLAAIEMIMLGLPWSLALGTKPMSRLDWPGMMGVVIGGIAVNGLLLWKITRLFERYREGRATTKAS